MLADILVFTWSAIAVTVYWLDYARIPAKIRWLDRKPFNCEACFPVWLFAVFYVSAIYGGRDIIMLIGSGFTAGIVTPLLLKLIRKW